MLVVTPHLSVSNLVLRVGLGAADDGEVARLSTTLGLDE